MTDVTDSELTQDFADHQSEAAFAQLVQRHINLVYSVALRFTGHAEDARDVTQAVFIILAQKAAGLRQRATLTGWLYETTRLTARHFLRGKTRQHIRDQEAYMQSHLNEPVTDSAWQQLAPQLEAAMSRLNENERALLALRFFENKTGEETAALLGIRADAAHKRTARAVEKLRGWLTKRGVTLTATVLTAAISANSVQAAPLGLAATVAATAAKGAVVSGSTLTLIKGALKVMAWTKMKTAVVVGVGVLLAAGTTSVAIYEANQPILGIPKDWSVLSGNADQWTWTDGKINAHSTRGDTILASSKKYRDVSLSVVTSTTNRDADIAFRMQDADNGYFVLFVPDNTPWAAENGSHISLIKRSVGDETTLATFKRQGLPQSAKITVNASGPAIEVRLNDVAILNVRDTAFSSGFVGLRISGDTGKPCDATFAKLKVH